jgi:heme a synthase
VHPSRATWSLLGVELAQGLVGFVQYFTDLPVVLVGVHLLGAALIAAVSTWMVIVVSGAVSPCMSGPVSGPVPGPVRARGEAPL